jgi:thiosulfate/3-mercaptopyruvate sulfurtransferase
VSEFARTLSKWSIDENVQVIVYDDKGGAIASRLWWMLRWLGHDAVALLDGGWPAWQGADLPVSDATETLDPRVFSPRPRPKWLVTTKEVMSQRSDPAWLLIDSRVPERYRGEVEPIDPIAGRIPGALNVPHPQNVGPDGLYLTANALRARFKEIVGDAPAERTVFYCGSGVTAARNLLAYAHAGLGDARLYAGSWSEWITDPNRPIATG